MRPTSIGLPMRTLSTGSSGSGSGMQRITHTSSQESVNRQSSQTSIFEHLASQAKELVRESTRQGSQERLLEKMDKVILIIVQILLSKL